MSGGRSVTGQDFGAVALVAGAAAGGAAATLAAGALVGMPGADLVRLLALLVPSAAVALAAAALAPRALAGRAMGVRLGAVALAGVAMALATLATVAALMFVSDHDALLVTVMLLYSGAVGVALAVALARSSAAAASHLARTAGELGRGNLAARAGPVRADLELAALARAIDGMAEELEAAVSRERELEGRRRDLMTAVSHDLRTPLAGLRAMVEAIDDGVVADAPTLRRYAVEMRRAIGSLSQLVDDLFELAQVDVGAIERETERVRLKDLVRSALSEVAVQADDKGLALEASLGGAGEALCSPRLLRVLQNLLQNAVRHTPADGTVRVAAVRDRGGITVAVEDTGEGISPEALELVFEPFWRGDPARSRSGSGLGLALAKRIVEALGGRIEVRSRVAEGSRFDVWIPATAALSGPR